MASEKIYVPLPPPLTTYEEDPRATLSATEQTMYDEVLAHFTRDSYTLPNVEKGELQENDKFWLSRDCILRFLRASKWKTETAITRLEHTLKWRREFGINDVVNAKHVEAEAVTGKEIMFGYDVNGRPAFYMIPSRQNTDEATRQIQFAFWMLERCIDLMEPGVENIALLINFADRAKNPSLSTARAVLNILQEHYPERLGRALIINVPFLVNAFFRIIMPFVDPVTREKVKFNPQILKEGYFAPDQVMSEWWGGDQNFEYVHEKYWPRFVEITEERTKRWRQSWRDLGAKVGISEWEYKKKAAASAATPANEVDKKEGEVIVAAVEEAPVVAAVTEAAKEKAEPLPEPEKAIASTVPEVKKSEVDGSGVHDEHKKDAATANHAEHSTATSGGSTATAVGAGAVAGGDSGDGAADGGGE